MADPELSPAGRGGKFDMKHAETPENRSVRLLKVGEQVLIDNQQSIRYIGLCYKHWKMGKAYA